MNEALLMAVLESQCNLFDNHFRLMLRQWTISRNVTTQICVHQFQYYDQLRRGFEHVVNLNYMFTLNLLQYSYFLLKTRQYRLICVGFI